MSSTTEASSGGVGIVGLLGILFVGLKLGGVIDWSWLWVLSPFWLPLAAGASILLVVLICNIVFGRR